MIKNLKIRSKLFLITMVTTILLIFAYTVLFIQEKSIIESVEYSLDVSFEYAIKAKDMEKHVVEVQQWLTDISATRGADGFDDGFDEAESSRQNFLSKLRDFEELYTKENNKEGLEQLVILEKVFESWYSTGKVMAKGYIKGGPTTGNQLMGAFDQVAVDLGDKLNKFVSEQSVNVRNKLINVNEEMVMLSNNLAVIFILILVTLWGMTIAIVRNVDISVLQLRQSMELVIKEGKLNQKLIPKGKDEISEIVKMFNTLLTTISNMISETNTVVTALSEGDLTQRISSNQTGDFDTLKQGVNNSADSIQDVLVNLTTISESLKKGIFKISVESNAKGQYKDIQMNMESSLDTLNSTVNDVQHVMKDMRHGKFDSKVTVEAQGAFNDIKESVNKSMTMLSSTMDDIARVVIAQSSGDLSQIISNEYSGDVETIKNSINHSNLTLNNIVNDIVGISDTVADAASEVNLNSNQLSNRMQEMSASLSDTSDSMQAITSLTQQNTDLAQQATKLADNANRKAIKGASISEQAVTAMNNITESSNKIKDIITLIDGIAFQTNLLALNAAVEAARAGEHGKGFAVVAGEVRALAQKSADASHEIKNLIERSSVSVKEGSKHVVDTGKALAQITTAITDVNSLVSEISTSSEDQTREVNNVNLKIQGIDDVNNALVKGTANAAESINHQASSLKSVIGFFNKSSLPVPRS